MKHSLLNLFLFLTTVAAAVAQTPYGYAPQDAAEAELSRIGSGKNGFIQGMVRFDPAIDPALARLREKGCRIKGVRCFLRDDYAQKRQKRSFVCAAEGQPGNAVRTTYCDFSTGWNDILFEEPLPIGDSPLFLGLQVYETIGSPLPLISYTDATVEQSCLVNIAKEGFEEYTNRGTLLVFALIEGEAAAELSRTAYAQNVSSPQTVAPRGTFEGGVYILNQSADEITSVRLATRGVGQEEDDVQDVTFETPLPAYGHTMLTLPLIAGGEEGTEARYEMRVTAVNGETAQEGRAGVSRLFVTVDNFQRIPLVEEFTSQACINCPQMAYFLEKAFDQLRDEGKPYIYLSRHSGFREDAFTTPTDRELTYVFGGYEKEYNPAIMYNRAILDGESAIIQGVRDMSPTPYLEAMAKAAEMPAKGEINIINGTDGISLTGRISRDLITKEVFLSLYYVEDGIPTTTYTQLGMDDADAPADLGDVFRHNGVCAHTFNAAPLGDLLTPAADGTFNMVYPPIPADVKTFGGREHRLVAVLSRINKTDLGDNEVLNAAELPLAPESGINSAETATKQQLRRYDLQGRSISGKPRSGLYIENGKIRLATSN